MTNESWRVCKFETKIGRYHDYEGYEVYEGYEEYEGLLRLLVIELIEVGSNHASGSKSASPVLPVEPQAIHRAVDRVRMQDLGQHGFRPTPYTHTHTRVIISWGY